MELRGDLNWLLTHQREDGRQVQKAFTHKGSSTSPMYLEFCNPMEGVTAKYHGDFGMRHACIAVHTGAGFYQLNDRRFSKLCQATCSKVLEFLDEDMSALDAACAAVAILEDDPITNAGFGSNLTRDGHVECDASVMDARSGMYGACGAVSGMKNPVFLAKKILTNQQSGQEIQLGLMPPMLLVGEGACRYADSCALAIIDPATLVVDSRKKKWDALQLALLGTKTDLETESLDVSAELDTVGAIAIDKQGNVAVASSSGGMLMKLPGRVGQAATYGAGIWAEEEDGTAVACCTSGTGEQLIRTLLAKELCSSVKRDMFSLASDVSRNVFVQHRKVINRNSIVPPYMGALLFQTNDWSTSATGFVHVVHTTPGFCWGLASTKCRKPKVEISRRSPQSPSHMSVATSGYAL